MSCIVDFGVIQNNFGDTEAASTSSGAWLSGYERAPDGANDDDEGVFAIVDDDDDDQDEDLTSIGRRPKSNLRR